MSPLTSTLRWISLTTLFCLATGNGSSAAGEVVTLASGQLTLASGQIVQLGSMQLRYQGGGNLVLYDSGNHALWATNLPNNLKYNVAPYAGDTTGLGTDAQPCAGCTAVFQPDGNLVLYNANYNGNASHAYWATATAVPPGSPAPKLLAMTQWPFLEVLGADGLSKFPLSTFSVSSQSYFVRAPTDNAVDWDQVPFNGDLFVGRQSIDSVNGIAKLVVAKMDWPSHTLQTVNPSLLVPNVKLPNGWGAKSKATVTTAYDPALLYAYGELWVSFECGADQFTSVCMGPISGATTDATGKSWTLDLSRTSVVVKANTAGGKDHSASVPKPFFWHSIPYLYYSAVHAHSGTHQWTGASTRGLQLQNTANGPGGMFWAAGSSGTVGSVDDATSVEVLHVVATDSLSNEFADGFAVATGGPAGQETAIYLTGGLGGSAPGGDCLIPTGGFNASAPRCYRQFIAMAKTPLGDGIFNKLRVSEQERYMPRNSSQYVRRMYDNTGSPVLWGFYYPNSAQDPLPGWEKPYDPNNTLMWAVPIPGDFAGMNFQ